MMQTRPLSVEEICTKLRPVLGEKVDEMYFRYTVAGSREEREDIEHILNALYLKHLNRQLGKDVLLEPPKEGVLGGTYTLGDIMYSKKKLYPFNLREQDWKRHVCITGMSGSGKTTLAFTIAEALNAHTKNFLIFDWKKSFRPLLSIHPELAIFTIGDAKVTNLFKTNINRPPKGVSPKEWITVLTDLLVESFFASFGVHKVLLETLDEAFKEWGIYEGSENYPTWKHIKWRLEEKFAKVEGRESGWIESAMRIATVLTFGEFGEILNYKKSDAVSVEDLLDKKVIMELNSLGSVEKKFFCEFILMYIYKLKKARQNKHDAHFDHAIIVDEAHNIFLKKQTNFTNESVTDMIYREMREYGTSLVCLDQHISMISDTVKGNSACVIAFQQQLPADIEDVSHLMQLQESKHYFSNLEVGEAIIKLAERYKTPFLIKAPYPKTREQNTTDKDVQNRAKAVLIEKMTKKEDPKFLEEVTKGSIPEKERIHNEETTKKEMGKKEGEMQQTMPQQATAKTMTQEKVVKTPTQTITMPTLTPVNASPLTQKNASVKKETFRVQGIPAAPVVRLEQPKEVGIPEKKEVEKEITEKPLLKSVTQKETLQIPVKKERKNAEKIIEEDKIVDKENILLEEQTNGSDRLTEVQEMLMSYVNAHLTEGISLDVLEETLEKGKISGNYTSSDIIKVINRVLEGTVEKGEETLKKKKINEIIDQNADISEDERKFIAFLQEHPNHTYSTVEVYRHVGLSARKGTVIKKQLETKGLIRVEEKRNEKGWKKLLRLT